MRCRFTRRSWRSSNGWSACSRSCSRRGLNRFLSPTLLGVGLALAVAGLVVISRPVVDPRLRAERRSRLTARQLVGRHGTGTLDYFALARRQAALLRRRHARPLRGARRRVPRVARPDRADRGPVRRLGGVLPLRRRAGLDRGGARCRRQLARHLPPGRDALALHRRRGGRRPARLRPGRRPQEGPTPGREPDRPLRLHHVLPRPARARRHPRRRGALRHGAEPARPPRARVLHDPRPAVRSRGRRAPPGGGPRPSRASRSRSASSSRRRASAGTRSTSCAATRGPTRTG